MDKGARVTIISGKGKDVSGEVFWKGENKWGPGERLGVRGDDGETYWVADSDVELAGGPAPVIEAGPTFDKGDRVSFTEGGEPGTGTVFWTGESKGGPGQRVGVRDDATEDAVWKDSRHCVLLEGDADPMPRRQDGPAAPMDGDVADIPWEDPLDVDDGPPAAPWDDADAASAASGADDQDVAPWEDPF